MSCDWWVYCRTCDEELSYPSLNHGEDTLTKLIRAAPQIVQIYEISKSVPDNLLTVDVQALHMSFDASWFKKHLGHDMVPRNEYHVCLDRCGVRVKCGECGTGHLCNLPVNHEGNHKP